VQLQYISLPLLIAQAGGDPWAINQSLQSGRPAQIADLAEAFHTTACKDPQGHGFVLSPRGSGWLPHV
ncbi:hypothetical protein MNAB215_2027, partial [Mycobacterium numidiamassiliense]